MKLSQILIISLSFASLVAACADRNSEAAQGSMSSGTPTADGTFIPVLPGIQRPCGVHNAEEAAYLVEAGQAVALVQATISQPPGRSTGIESRVQVDSYSLLAGQLPDGSVDGLLEASAANNFLPAGTFMLLLGDAGESETYFVSDGLLGSFVVQGDNAYEQCPDYAHSGSTFLASSGVTIQSQLAALLASAISNSTNVGSQSADQTPESSTRVPDGQSSS